MAATDRRRRGGAGERGFTLIEVLVAITIVVVGLLGLAGMQARAQIAEFESYQRAQALVLLSDMVDRINNNRLAASCFAVTNAATGAPFFGTGSAVTPACSASSVANNAMAVAAMTDWNNMLLGTQEQKSGSSVGAMIGARGCISYDASTEYLNASTGTAYSGTGEYTISVSWQGMADTFTPTKTCGSGQYGSETKRRTVWATMRVGTLAAR